MVMTAHSLFLFKVFYNLFRNKFTPRAGKIMSRTAGKVIRTLGLPHAHG